MKKNFSESFQDSFLEEKNISESKCLKKSFDTKISEQNKQNWSTLLAVAVLPKAAALRRSYKKEVHMAQFSSRLDNLCCLAFIIRNILIRLRLIIVPSASNVRKDTKKYQM